MPIKPEHLDELLAGHEKPEDLLGEDGLFKQCGFRREAASGSDGRQPPIPIEAGHPWHS